MVKNYATGKSKGFGFVEYKNRESAQEVIDVQFHEIKGVKVSCSLYLKRGKKYHKEFKELEKKMKKSKFKSKKSKSFQFLDDIDASKSYTSSKNDSLNLNKSQRHPGSHRGSFLYSHAETYPNAKSAFSSEGSSYFNNSNSVASGNNFLLPPQMNFGNKNSTGVNFQNYYQQQNRNIYQEQPGKRMSMMSLNPSTMQNQAQNLLPPNPDNNNFHHRRSLFTPHQGGLGNKKKKKKNNKNLPMIMISHIDEEIQNFDGQNDFIKSPTNSNYSSQEQRIPPPGFKPWGGQQLGGKFDRRFTVGTQHTGNPANIGPNNLNPNPNMLFQGYMRTAKEEIFQGENSQCGISNSNLSVNETEKKQTTMGKFDLLPPPVSLGLMNEGGKVRVKSFDLKEIEKLSNEEEGKEGKVRNKDDSFDENMLLKECFNL